MSMTLESFLKYAPIDVPVMLWGPPGVGKTDRVDEFVKVNEYQMCLINLLLCDPIDLRGACFVRDGRTVWARPATFPDEDDKRPGIIFIDEITAAVPALQKVAQQVVHEGRAGEHILPKSYRKVCAGNRATDRAGTFQMPAPLITRMVHLGIGSKVPGFAEWLPEHTIPDVASYYNNEWKPWALTHNIDGDIIAFLRWKREVLYQGQAVPRTWEILSKLLDTELFNTGRGLGVEGEEDGRNESREYTMNEEIISGTVGKGAMHEFVTFTMLKNRLPDAEDIMRDPKSVPPIPDTEVSLMYALEGALVNALRRKKTKERAAAALQYAIALRPEFAVVCFRDLLAICPEASKTKQFSAFTKKFKNLV